jgi:anti-sigma regulatory factor (Ser/Thr protein kinase)
MTELPNVRLTLSSKPENVLLVREMLSGVAETVGLGGVELQDVRTAVTEACNNVVLHAYGDREGPLETEVYLATPGALTVVVRDRGTGIRPRMERRDGSINAGLGLPVIEALVREVELRGSGGDGTEVRMEFAAPEVEALTSPMRDGYGLVALAESQARVTATIALAPPRLAQTVLPRLLAVLSVHARFSTDLVADARRLAELLAGRTAAATRGEHLGVVFETRPRELQLRIGPLAAGTAERMLGESALGAHRGIVQALADERSAGATGAAETLVVHLADQRPRR